MKVNRGASDDACPCDANARHDVGDVLMPNGDVSTGFSGAGAKSNRFCGLVLGKVSKQGKSIRARYKTGGMLKLSETSSR